MAGQNLAMELKLGNTFKCFLGNPPAVPAAGTRSSPSAIQRLTPGAEPGARFQGCTLVLKTGAVSGAPTSFSVDAKIQTSATGSGGWADYIPPGQSVVASIGNGPGVLTAANQEAEVEVDLSGALAYIQVVETVAFVGGTSPTVGADETVILYGADRTPPAGK